MPIRTQAHVDVPLPDASVVVGVSGMDVSVVVVVTAVDVVAVLVAVVVDVLVSVVLETAVPGSEVVASVTVDARRTPPAAIEEASSAPAANSAPAAVVHRSLRGFTPRSCQAGPTADRFPVPPENWTPAWALKPYS
jgi:hypothetical protein